MSVEKLQSAADIAHERMLDVRRGARASARSVNSLSELGSHARELSGIAAVILNLSKAVHPETFARLSGHAAQALIEYDQVIDGGTDSGRSLAEAVAATEQHASGGALYVGGASKELADMSGMLMDIAYRLHAMRPEISSIKARFDTVAEDAQAALHADGAMRQDIGLAPPPTRPA